MTGSIKPETLTIKRITKCYPELPSIEEIRVSSSPALFDDINDAIDACCAAQAKFSGMPIVERKRIIQAIRDASTYFAADFALCALAETGRGRYEDKLAKQKLAINSTPGVEDIQPRVYTGDNGMTTIDMAPLGVIGAVTPVTNPTATIINNSITILSGGNGAVFNPHPAAMHCTNRAVAVVNDAITQAGGPPALIASVHKPTIESGNIMMKHPKTAANLVTGGPAVVKVALGSGKKSFCAGPGNPPVLVDSSADVCVAAKGIYDGASFDNNMICSDEKEAFVVAEVYDKLIEELKKVGAYIASPEEIKKLEGVVFAKPPVDWEHGEVVRENVGSSAYELAKKAGINVPQDCRLIVCQVEAKHPLVWTEQLMPVLPIVKVADFKEGLELSKKAEHGFRHTASIYSGNLHNITEMAQTMNTSVFTVNGPHTAGLGEHGEGYTSFSIAGCTGEGMTRPSTFVRERRLVCVDALRFV